MSLILPWIAENCEIRGIILIQRHPCAVVSSWRKHFGNRNTLPLAFKRYIQENLSHLQCYISSLRKEEELLAAAWCCNHHLTLIRKKKDSLIKVFYEKLVLDGASEIKRIFSELGISEVEAKKAIKSLRRNSLTSHQWSADHSRASTVERISNWKRYLNSQETKRVLNVVSNFGIKGYSEDPIPNFENIMVSD